MRIPERKCCINREEHALFFSQKDRGVYPLSVSFDRYHSYLHSMLVAIKSVQVRKPTLIFKRRLLKKKRASILVAFFCEFFAYFLHQILNGIDLYLYWFNTASLICIYFNRKYSKIFK